MNRFHLMVKSARIWATQMGYEGEAHKDEVFKLVTAQLEDY